jgi:hypothetical protein
MYRMTGGLRQQARRGAESRPDVRSCEVSAMGWLLSRDGSRRSDEAVDGAVTLTRAGDR